MGAAHLILEMVPIGAVEAQGGVADHRRIPPCRAYHAEQNSVSYNWIKVPKMLADHSIGR